MRTYLQSDVVLMISRYVDTVNFYADVAGHIKANTPLWVYISGNRV